MSASRSSILGMLCALVAAFSAGMVIAQDQMQPGSDAGIAAARELIAATGAAKQFETVVPMMVKQLEPILLHAAPGKEAEVKDIMAKMVQRFSERKSEILEIIAGIYASKLSSDQLRDLTKFFSAGAGAQFIAKQPEILQDSMTAGQKWGEKIGLELEQEIRQELTKRGIKI